MSGILILSYKLKEVTNSYVLHFLGTSKNWLYPCKQMLDCDGVWNKILHFKWASS